MSVRIWGFGGPLGAFICGWGGVAMLVSAPFDDWWHNAYGLDVKIISPPHMVLAAGFFGIEFGTVMLLLAFMNRSDDALQRPLQRLFLYVGGIVVCESLLLKLEYISRSEMHSALFYIVVMIGTPGILVAIAVASRQRWACTIMAAVYTAFGVAFLWILPLVPAEPKLGPVYRQVTHLIPWEFPLLIMIPAFAIDLILRRSSAWRPIVGGLVNGSVFLITFMAVQWPFANFLMTPLARNRVIGTAYMDYRTPPQSIYARYEFLPQRINAAVLARMLIAALISFLTMWVALARRPGDAEGQAVKPRRFWAVVLFVATTIVPRSASAHVGSPDVFLDGLAGAYRLFVTVRPPHAVPGVAEVEVLTASDDVTKVQIVPLPLTGPGAQFAPQWPT